MSMLFGKVMNLINKIFIYIFRFFAIEDKLIVLESEGDFTDNAQALFQYMLDNEYLKKYRIVWLVENVNKYRKEKHYENTIFCSKKWNVLHINTSYYLARCHYYIYDHNHILCDYTHREGQEVIYITHGIGYKESKGFDWGNSKSKFDKMIVPSEFGAIKTMRYWQVERERIAVLGYPRLDYFFSDLSDVRVKVNNKLHFESYKKVILWMPTFRKSTNKALSEDYLNFGTGLPLMDSEHKLDDFDKYLRDKNILIILKIHHLQAELPIFKKKYLNINFITDQHIEEMGIQLYQFIPLTDALITDYSSISVDYMLINKPIGYTLDDYEQYKQSRGLWPENTKDYLIGKHIYEIEELLSFVDDIAEDIDLYKDSRENNIHVYQKYTDGNASKRLLDYLHITIQ